MSFNKIQIPLTCGAAAPHRRIWWYPTGPLTFIPIHAAGPGNHIDVSRLVICSHVTTLYSLFQAQKKRGQLVTGWPKLLTICQPNTPNRSPLPQSTTEVNKVMQIAASAGWSEENIENMNGLDATVIQVSSALDECSWVHFACHGLQHPTSGMKSAFVLHDGNLELGQIASKRLGLAQFAYLSVCQAASGLNELPGKAMHLAAGIQFAGFPGVIATMWSVHDEDAPKVAEHTYQYLLRNGLEGLDPSEAAAALNYAISHLRKDATVTMDRWAPFIHFGF